MTTTSPEPDTDRHPRMRVNCQNGGTCDACGQPVTAGDHVIVWSTPPVITHEHECPAGWTPEVIDGDQEPAQQTLPGLALTLVRHDEP